MRNLGTNEIRVRGGLCRVLSKKSGSFEMHASELQYWVERDGEGTLELAAIQRVGQKVAKQQPYELEDNVRVGYSRGKFTVTERPSVRSGRGDA